MGWIRALILLCALTGIVAAQKPGVTTLPLGTPIERTIAPGQTHIFSVTAEENTLVQLTVEQRGIDVVVRIQRPHGNKSIDYDSPNGADGPENVSFIVTEKLPYFVEVTPLSRDAGPAGKYEIRLIEMRPATEQELKESKGQEALKARGLALLGELDGAIAEVRLPQTRIKAQMQAAGLLWESDEKRAQKYVTDAITGFKEWISNVDPDSREYNQTYNILMNLRYEIVYLLMGRQPEMALNFFRSTPPLTDPYGNQRERLVQEAETEMQIANQLAAKDPKRTLQIARENLKTQLSPSLINTLNSLRRQSPEMAAELAGEIASKLLSDKLPRNSQAAGLLIGLIQMTGQPSGNQDFVDTNGSAPQRASLLSDQQRRDLLQKALSEALAIKPLNPNLYSPERDFAWNLLHGLHQMGTAVDAAGSGYAAALDKRFNELSVVDNSMRGMQEFQNALNNPNMPLDELIQVLSKAPADQKDQLFTQLASRVQTSGDIARAKQIVNDYITTPFQRQQVLYNLETQEMYRAMAKGKVDDALRSIANLSNPQERAQALTQVANQIGPGYKRAAALLFLDQARGLLPPSLQARDQGQMQALLEIAKAYSRYDSKRAFEIVDPLIDQFNELTTAARTMEGFAGQYYEQDELNLQNGNVLANVANQLTSALGTLGLTNFDRAKLTVERFRLPEVRLRAYLDIAQQAIQNQR
jgi:hypothetical protein